MRQRRSRAQAAGFGSGHVATTVARVVGIMLFKAAASEKSL
jgi:hypothetical protein